MATDAPREQTRLKNTKQNTHGGETGIVFDKALWTRVSPSVLISMHGSLWARDSCLRLNTHLGHHDYSPPRERDNVNTGSDLED